LGGDRRGIVEEFVWYEEAGARAVTCEEEGGREEERAGPKPKRRGEMGLLSDALSVFIPAPAKLDSSFLGFSPW
jgi:hypothetical protein